MPSSTHQEASIELSFVLFGSVGASEKNLHSEKKVVLKNLRIITIKLRKNKKLVLIIFCNKMKLSGNSFDKKICSLFVEKKHLLVKGEKLCNQNIITRLDKSAFILKIFNPAVAKIYPYDNASTRVFD